MVSGGCWLVLKVLPLTEGPDSRLKRRLLISVPKKIIRLASRRNRLKRLLRETFRLDLGLGSDEKVLHFKVAGDPGKHIGLNEVRLAVKKLKKENEIG